MDFCRYSKSGLKSGKYFQKGGKIKVVPRVTVRGMRVPKSVGDVKDFPKKNYCEVYKKLLRKGEKYKISTTHRVI